MSPYKDAEKRKQAAKDSMAKKRKGLTSGVNKVEGSTSKIAGVNIPPEHPIMKYLIEPALRLKMEAVVQSLKNHKQLENVSLGYCENSIPLDVAGDLLDATGR